MEEQHQRRQASPVGPAHRLRYRIANGNGAELIRRQFRVRKGWSPLTSAVGEQSVQERQRDILARADLIWCQYRSSLGALDQDREAFAPQSFEIFANLDAVTAWRDQAQNEANDKLYIVKPGSGTNRGVGIFMARSRAGVARALTEQIDCGTNRKSWVVQDYIERPLLVHGRKFDIRCFALLVFSENSSVMPLGTQDSTASPAEGCEQGFRLYLHDQAYVRTSSRPYSTKNLEDRFVHLTNDAVQSKAREYGRAEAANKLSFDQLAEALEASEGPGAGAQVRESFWPQIRTICHETFRNAVTAIQPSRRGRRFELFGLDFMITDEGHPQEAGAEDKVRRVQLIEVNENPCLERVCPLLAAIIPKVIDDTFAIVLDSGVFFPASQDANTHRKSGFEELPLGIPIASDAEDSKERLD
ncbi:Tubulin glycylase 3D [Hondaea fermentalgiana]|uniref:Tubulin glycylase 3D n=1 Tax=Hondaea fermentalgiana TaxID=2315210 RepID=A0A2R5H210_9STRA|nr:Tubulin glycylase 3D [Hondaea fermentalgiana]|eukprot:GBG34404.1 Tubulin glycylase 3D [Hondaea fermentalgiana]